MVVKTLNPILLLALQWTVLLAELSTRNCENVKWTSEYDYIVVGGGTAGSVVAGRLSEKSYTSVLVLEAGIDDTLVPFAEVPLASQNLIDLQSGLVWGLQSEPEKNASQSMKDQRVQLHQGRILGGTSQINGLLYVRGSAADFNVWAEEGNKGWAFEDVLPYFKKSERNLNSDLNPEYHGFSGPWIIEDSNVSPELIDRFLMGGVELGHREIEPNDPIQRGFSRLQTNSFLGRRMSLSRAFLKPNLGRPNLEVKTLAYVTKILISQSRAQGVQYMDLMTQQMKFVKARREVIVSAGALLSPKLLMLSGIGPRKHLEMFNVPVISDLPVGDNLQDHYGVQMSYKFNKTITPSLMDLSSFETLSQYIFTGKGPWSTSSVQATAFVRPDNSSYVADLETIRLHLTNIPMGLFGSDNPVTELGLKEEVFSAMYSRVFNTPGAMVLVSLTQPMSRGNVRLQSPNPFDNPEIVLNYFHYEEEVEELLTGIRFVQSLMNSEAFEDISPEISTGPHPDCLIYPEDSDDYWRCFLHQLTFTEYHYTSTCRMGLTPTTSVVDSKLRVHNVQSLRVVDASVMPRIVSGNTMATTVMIAEKAADMIKGTKL